MCIRFTWILSKKIQKNNTQVDSVHTLHGLFDPIKVSLSYFICLCPKTKNNKSFSFIHNWSFQRRFCGESKAIEALNLSCSWRMSPQVKPINPIPHTQLLNPPWQCIIHERQYLEINVAIYNPLPLSLFISPCKLSPLLSHSPCWWKHIWLVAC